MRAQDRVGQAQDRPGAGVRAAVVALTALVLMVIAAVATAFEPVDGTEFLWTNASGTTLVGYGRVWDGALEIEFSGDGSEFRVLMIGPDGTVVDLRGEVRGGRPFLEIAGRGTVDLAQLLAESGLMLVMRYEDGTTQVMAPVGVDETDRLPDGAEEGVADARDETPSDTRPGAPEDRLPRSPEDRPSPPEDRGPPEEPGPPEDRPGPPEDRGRPEEPGPPEDRPGPPEDRGPAEEPGPPEDRPGPPDDRGPPEELPRDPENPRPPSERPVEPDPEGRFAPADDGAGHQRHADRRETPDAVVMA